MTATIAPPDTSPMYVAHRSNLRLVKQAIYPRYGAGGAKVGEFPGQTLEFVDGILSIQRESTRLGIPAEEIVEFLEGHKLFGSQDGFWRVDPVAPPVTQDELDALLQAASSLDVPALEAIVARERAGWARASLIEPAERAIAGITEALEQTAQQQAETPGA